MYQHCKTNFDFLCVCLSTVFLCSVGVLSTLQALFLKREVVQLNQLLVAMKGATNPTAMFDTWMKQESDAVQHTSLAFGEREVLEAGMRTAAQVSHQCVSFSSSSYLAV